MDEKVRQKIAEAAAAENGWKADEVRVDEIDRLRRPACSFYTAIRQVRPLQIFDFLKSLTGPDGRCQQTFGMWSFTPIPTKTGRP
jgi:hypothetical protein